MEKCTFFLFSFLSAFNCFSHRHGHIRNFLLLFSWGKNGVYWSSGNSALLHGHAILTHLMLWHWACCGQNSFASERHHCFHGTVGTGHASAGAGSCHTLWCLEHHHRVGPDWCDSKVPSFSKSRMCIPGKVLRQSLGIPGWRLEQRASIPSALLQCVRIALGWSDLAYPAFPAFVCFLHLTMHLLIEASQRYFSGHVRICGGFGEMICK